MEVKEFVKQASIDAGWGEDYNGLGLYRLLVDSIDKHTPWKLIREARWWDYREYVVEVNSRHVAFVWGRANGDMSMEGRGFEFDWDTVGFVKLSREMVEVITWEDDD